jgi:hypothetical protein
VLLGSLESTEQGDSNGTSRRANRGVEAKSRVKAVNGHSAVRKACGNLGGKWEMGQESKL